MRRACFALAALALTACSSGEVREALDESRPPASLAERFQAPEGWAWGRLAPPQGPQIRYGVAAPAGEAARGDVLILPAYGEPAEVWFETTRDLLARGWRVWILERAGQGGAGRYLQPHDLGHSRGFEGDAEAVRALIGQVVRPSADGGLAVLAAGDGALVAVMAAEAGAGLDRLVLSAPALEPLPGAQPWEAVLGRIGLGRLPSLAWRPWRRSDPPEGPPSAAGSRRDGLAHRWQTANPDLRLTGPSLGWQAAFERARRKALDNPAAVTRPILILAPQPLSTAAKAFCDKAASCETAGLPSAGGAPHLVQDSIRCLWFERLSSFLAEAGVEAAASTAEPRPHEM